MEIIEAARNGDIAFISGIKSKGLNIEVEDENGNMPLHHAVLANQKPMVDLLLQLIIKPDRQNKKGETPLHIAAAHPTINLDIPVALMDAGIDIGIFDMHHATMLHVAASAGNFQLVNKILDHPSCNPDLVNVKDNVGWTPLNCAINVVKDSKEIIAKLVSKNATITLPHLILASYLGNIDAINLIIKGNEKLLNEGDDNKRTCLHHAILGRAEGQSRSKHTFAHLQEIGAKEKADIRGLWPSDLNNPNIAKNFR